MLSEIEIIERAYPGLHKIDKMYPGVQKKILSILKGSIKGNVKRQYFIQQGICGYDCSQLFNALAKTVLNQEKFFDAKGFIKNLRKNLLFFLENPLKDEEIKEKFIKKFCKKNNLEYPDYLDYSSDGIGVLLEEVEELNV